MKFIERNSDLLEGAGRTQQVFAWGTKGTMVTA